MIVILIILAAAAVGAGLARWRRLPLVPLLILSGIGIALLNLNAAPQLFQDALLLGLAFLVFSFGTEMNPARVGKQGQAAVVVGLLQFVSLAAVGFGAAFVLGFDWLTSLYLALAVAASSTLVVLQLLKQRQRLFEPFGRLVVGVLLIQDFLIILLIAGLTNLEEGAAAVFVSVNGTLGLMAFAYVMQRWVAPWLFVKNDLSQEEQLLAVLAVLFLFIGAADLIGVSIVVGAFLAGVSLSSFPVSGIFRGQAASLTDFFLALFFVALGATLTWPNWRELILALALAGLVLAVTPVLVVFVARRAGVTIRSSLESGLLLAQTSEFSIIVGLIGVQLGHLDGRMLSVITLVTIVTMIATPFVATERVTALLLHIWTRWRRVETAVPFDNHILLLGCGDHGFELLKWLREHEQKVAVVDDDSAVTRRARSLGAVAIRGDATDPLVLRQARAAEARVIVSTLQRPQSNLQLLDFVGDVPTLFSVFEPDEARRLAAAGGTPILESYLSADRLIEWFEAWTGEEEVGSEK
jgi:Kef-type K+ transport system membrane component KefB